jgi:hypothetical protein
MRIGDKDEAEDGEPIGKDPELVRLLKLRDALKKLAAEEEEHDDDTK